MDPRRPATISPELSLYAERSGLFELLQRCTSSLLIDRPDDPIGYLIDLLKKDFDAPKIIVLGAPSSGQLTIAKMLQQRLNVVLIEPEELLQTVPAQFKDKLPPNATVNDVPSPLWAKLIQERLKSYDCFRRGWVLVGLPKNREQALALQSNGISPKHVICLEASDAALIERAAGKRIDPKTKDVYHITWNVPSSQEVHERLVQLEETSEKRMVSRLKEYRRNIDGVKDCFKSNLRAINADQPLNDVYAQVKSFVSRQARSAAPCTPRVLILGPTCSGRKTAAKQIADKYDLPIVSIPTLIKQQIANKTSMGVSMKPYVTRQSFVPDSLLMPLIRERLQQKDCTTKGWIMLGFPRTREQAERLARTATTTPNRIVFLDIPLDVALERLPVQHSDDRREAVQKRYEAYMTYYDELHEFYARQSPVHLPADQDARTVAEAIEAAMVSPLNHDHDDD